jgi:hypothetical protein
MALAPASATTVVEEAAPADAAPVETAEVAEPAQPAVQAGPAIYEPLVDMNRVNRAKYARDLAACRGEAAPQEQAARAAAERQANGTAIQTMGIVASVLPVRGLRAQTFVDAASSTAQNVGAATAEEGAISAANAAADYALVMNNCLEHRGYRLLHT